MQNVNVFYAIFWYGSEDVSVAFIKQQEHFIANVYAASEEEDVLPSLTAYAQDSVYTGNSIEAVAQSFVQHLTKGGLDIELANTSLALL